MKIIVCSYFYPPDNTPRSFRAFELVKELQRKGHNVEVVFLKRNNNKCLNRTKVIKKNKFRFIISNLAHSVLPGGKHFFFFFYLVSYFKKNRRDVDIVISIAMPFSVHMGVAYSLCKGYLKARSTFADYGDPFYDQNRNSIYYYLEKKVLNSFSWVIVPVEKGKTAFKKFNITSKLIVIPQGVDFSQFEISVPSKGDLVKFAYAGVFYFGLREPIEFLEYLSDLKNDCEFHIYVDHTHGESMRILRPYINLDSRCKLVLHDSISRTDCIYELSKFDFLINFENTSKTQSPSKLIDYHLTKRPILQVKTEKGKFCKDTFIQYLNGDFSKKFYEDFNLEDYDIRNCVAALLKRHVH